MTDREQDQTLFLEDQPWPDQNVTVPMSESEVAITESAKKPRTLVLVVVMLLVVTTLVLLVLAVMFFGRQRSSPLPFDRVKQSGEQGQSLLEKEVASLSAELKKADPIQPEYPFPPVRMDLEVPTIEVSR